MQTIQAVASRCGALTLTLLVGAALILTGCDAGLSGPDLSADQTSSGIVAKKGGPSAVDVSFFDATGNYYAAVDAGAAIRWAEARAATAAMKYKGCTGHLATITSAKENAFLVDTFPVAIDAGYWLGGAQASGFGEPSGGWGWITGEPFVYENWNGGEPNNFLDAEASLHFFPTFFGPQDKPGTWNDQDGGAPSGDIDGVPFALAGYMVEFECPQNGRVVERATGSGHFTVGGELRTFSFNARKYEDGTVEGEWQQNNRAADAKEHGNVTCFAVEGNQVWLGGFAEQGAFSTAPNNEVGWSVVDNGEGRAAPADQITLKFIGQGAGFASAYCTATPQPGEAFGLDLNDVEKGNIQVKP